MFQSLKELFRKKPPAPMTAVYAGPEEMLRRRRDNRENEMRDVYAGPEMIEEPEAIEEPEDAPMNLVYGGPDILPPPKPKLVYPENYAKEEDAE